MQVRFGRSAQRRLIVGVVAASLLTLGCVPASPGAEPTTEASRNDERPEAVRGHASPEDLLAAYRERIQEIGNDGCRLYEVTAIASFAFFTEESQLATMESDSLDLMSDGSETADEILRKHGIEKLPDAAIELARSRPMWAEERRPGVEALDRTIRDREGFLRDVLEAKGVGLDELTQEQAKAIANGWGLSTIAGTVYLGVEGYEDSLRLVESKGRWYLEGPFEAFIRMARDAAIEDLFVPDASVRSRAADALASMGDHAAPAVPALGSVVSGEADGPLRAPRLDEAPAFFELPGREAGVFERNAASRAATARALGSLGRLSFPAVSDLLQGTSDASAEVRRASADALKAIADDVVASGAPLTSAEAGELALVWDRLLEKAEVEPDAETRTALVRSLASILRLPGIWQGFDGTPLPGELAAAIEQSFDFDGEGRLKESDVRFSLGWVYTTPASRADVVVAALRRIADAEVPDEAALLQRHGLTTEKIEQILNAAAERTAKHPAAPVEDVVASVADQEALAREFFEQESGERRIDVPDETIDVSASWEAGRVANLRSAPDSPALAALLEDVELVRVQGRWYVAGKYERRVGTALPEWIEDLRGAPETRIDALTQIMTCAFHAGEAVGPLAERLLSGAGASDDVAWPAERRAILTILDALDANAIPASPALIAAMRSQDDARVRAGVEAYVRMAQSILYGDVRISPVEARTLIEVSTALSEVKTDEPSLKELVAEALAQADELRSERIEPALASEEPPPRYDPLHGYR